MNETRYAKSGELSIAYQLAGDGSLDLVVVPGVVSHVEAFHELPSYSRFIERIQFIDWTHNHDWNGHYGFTALMVPQAPAAAGFTEAIISTYRLSALHGAPDARIRRQAERAARRFGHRGHGHVFAQQPA